MRKEVTMGQYFCCVGLLTLLLCGLIFVLSSCEKDGIDNDSKRKIMLNFSLDGISYDDSETLTRGYSSSIPEAAVVLLNDDLCMYATLEKNTEAPTRATVALEDGVIVRVVAYDGTTVKGTGEYKVSSGALLSSNGSGFAIDEGTYTFVAYSYNSKTVAPAYSEPSITVSPDAYDLLWGSSVQPVNASNNNVSITMGHKFSYVKVKILTTSFTDTPGITDIEDVEVTPNHSAVLTLLGGAMTDGSEISHTFSSWTGKNTTMITSDDSIRVNTNNSASTYVNIGSITLDLEGYSPFTDLCATFTKPLSGGTSYTLVVSFKKTTFAQSNIYWVSTGGNDGYLTFDKGTSANSMCQGVFFRFGSLVGVSPSGTSFTAGSVVYRPTGTNPPTFTRTTPSSLGITSNFLNGIPYMPASGEDRGNYVLNHSPEISDWSDFSSLIGDICCFIDSGYRLPNWNELDPGNVPYNGFGGYPWDSSNPTSTPVAGGWTLFRDPALDDFSGSANASALGTTIRWWGISLSGTVFPASGYRTPSNTGAVYSPPNYAFYWTGSARTSNGTGGNALRSDRTLIHPAYPQPEVNALPVRCIRNN
jgi:hypothetical protein